jgi:hypothetical protein
MNDMQKNMAKAFGQWLPEYTSSKKYRAAEIVEFQKRFIRDESDGTIVVKMPDGTKGYIQAPWNFAARGEPAYGDMVLIYDDGYMSWIPRAKFDETYQLTGD